MNDYFDDKTSALIELSQENVEEITNYYWKHFDLSGKVSREDVLGLIKRDLINNNFAEIFSQAYPDLNLPNGTFIIYLSPISEYDIKIIRHENSWFLKDIIKRENVTDRIILPIHVASKIKETKWVSHYPYAAETWDLERYYVYDGEIYPDAIGSLKHLAFNYVEDFDVSALFSSGLDEYERLEIFMEAYLIKKLVGFDVLKELTGATNIEITKLSDALEVARPWVEERVANLSLM